MNALTQITEPADDNGCKVVGITIIYEDRETGLIAKRFADMLIASLGREEKCSLTCWRSELFDLPEFAEEIARDAAASEVVILSLRGDSSLSMATRGWIGTWLTGACDSSACLVALFDPERSRRGPAEGTRHYLRHVAGEARVGFFAHSVFEADCTGALLLSMSDRRPAPCKRRRRLQNRFDQVFPEGVAA